MLFCWIKKKLIYKWKKGKKEWIRPLNKLIESFPRTYQFCNDDLNKFVMFLRKDVFRYEYIDGWEKFNETPLPLKKDFCKILAMRIMHMPKRYGMYLK